MRQKPRRDIRDPLDRSHRLDCQESKDGSKQPQSGNRSERFADVDAAKTEARDAMAKQRIEKRCKQRGGERNQPGVKPETPVGIRERSNPRPRPQEPKALDGVDG